MNPTSISGGSAARPTRGRRLRNGAQASQSRSGGESGRPMWWWLLAAFLAFAVIVTGAFVWQRATRVTAQKIYDELVSLDPNVTEDQLKSQGYVYGGTVDYGWQSVNGREYPWYRYGGGTQYAPIDKFMADVRAGRESVLRLYVQGHALWQDSCYTDDGSDCGDGSSATLSVRVLWFDPNVAADWAEKDSSGQPATIHHDGKGQIREWWWRGGEVVTADKRFSRGIRKDDSFGSADYVLKHQPAIPPDPDSSGTVIMRYDESLCSFGSE